jgi:hypothetical protein
MFATTALASRSVIESAEISATLSLEARGRAMPSSEAADIPEKLSDMVPTDFETKAMFFFSHRLSKARAQSQSCLQKVVGLGRGHDLLVLQLVELQDVRDQGRELRGRRDNGERVEGRGIALDDGQRRLDLVRYVRDEVVLQRLDVPELLHHLVEVLEHEVYVVASLGDVDGREPDREVALGHLLRGLAQDMHGPVVGEVHLAPGDEAEGERGEGQVRDRLQHVERGDPGYPRVQMQDEELSVHEDDEHGVGQEEDGPCHSLGGGSPRRPLTVPWRALAHSSTAL